MTPETNCPTCERDVTVCPGEGTSGCLLYLHVGREIDHLRQQLAQRDATITRMTQKLTRIYALLGAPDVKGEDVTYQFVSPDPQEQIRKLTEAIHDITTEVDVGNAATEALDAIAKLCGCPTWEYPGQVVRDVEGLLKVATAARNYIDTMRLHGQCGCTDASEARLEDAVRRYPWRD